jgi:hypothetical protein
MKKLILNLGIFSLVLTLCSCSKDEPAASSTAKLLVTHASPDAPGVDLFVDNAKQNTTGALTFPNSTAYLTLNSGSRGIKVNAANTSTSVINATLNFEKDKNYSLFVVDSLSKISTVLLTDDLTAPATGKAHVRFVHLSPNAPAVDIAIKGGAVLFANTAFKGSKPFTPVDAGTYDVDVRVANTTTVALPLTGIKLEAGKIYTFFARGFLGGTGTAALNASIIVNK